MECIFCHIVNGKIPANLVFQDENVLAFDDIHPKAPHHVLVIPRRHIATINDLQEEDTQLIGQIIQTAKHIAKARDLTDDGYRLVMNCNANAGQEVFHIHCHLLGGRKLQWPPG